MFQKSADKFIADILKERTEHGKSAVTAQQRHWINLAQTELGDLAILPKVIAHWKKTGDEAITPTLVKDAVVEFKKTQVNRVSETTF